MKYLGIDYGTRRVGVAVSDDNGSIAFPREVIGNKSFEEILQSVHEFAVREDISVVVLGLPRRIEGMDGAVREEILRFGEALEAKGVAVAYEDEMLTTKIAEAHSTANRDASAAALILQSYLDRRNSV